MGFILIRTGEDLSGHDENFKTYDYNTSSEAVLAVVKFLVEEVLPTAVLNDVEFQKRLALEAPRPDAGDEGTDKGFWGRVAARQSQKLKAAKEALEKATFRCACGNDRFIKSALEVLGGDVK